jgi:hypothetical protein
MYWQQKGANSTTGPASRLLCIQSLHQRHHRYVPSFDYISGEAHAMSEDCSRRWDLTDTQPLAHFDLVFPQSQPWRICPLPKRMRCALTSALLTNESNPVLPLNDPKLWTIIGLVGTHSAWRTILKPTSKAWADPVPILQVFGERYRDGRLAPSRTPSRLTQWRTPYVPWARRTPD